MQREVAPRGGVPSRAPHPLPVLMLPLLLALIFGGGGNPAHAQAAPPHHMHPPACDPDAPVTYTAAVVEFSPALGVTLENIQERFQQNVQHYVEYAKAAKRQGAEIVVFPEYGLVTMEMPLLPDSTIPVALTLPPLGANPCTEDSPHYPEELRTLSCAAREAAIYIVVNLPEEEHCSPALSFCPECPGFDLSAVRSGIVACNLNGKRYFNSDIAFDRKGAVVARYRKYNLFGEAGFVPPAEPSLEFFDSDFGPRFGLFTCFDLMFEKPAMALVTEAAVTDVIFPTAWFSELPFLTAVQAQSSWSWVLDVNFLGSGYNLPEVGSTGSGIYAGRRGKVVATMEREHANKLLVGKLPNRNSCRYNATASALGCPRLEGKVVALNRVNWDPEPSPRPPAPVPQPCADGLPASGENVPSLYQCHLNTMIQLKGERQPEEEAEVKAEEVAGEGEAEVKGEEGEGVNYELHIPREGEGDVQGEGEGEGDGARVVEEELRADEEEFKEAVAPAGPATLRQLIHGPRFRRYLQMQQKKQDQKLKDVVEEDAQERFAEYVRRCEDNLGDKTDDEQKSGTAIECPEDPSPLSKDWDEAKDWDAPQDWDERADEPMYEEEIADEAVYAEERADELECEEVRADEAVYEEERADEPVYEEVRAEEPLDEDEKMQTFAAGLIEELVDEAVNVAEVPAEVPAEEAEEYPEGEEGETQAECECEQTSEWEDEKLSPETEAKTRAWLEQPGISGPSIARDGGYLYLKTEDMSQYTSVLLPATGNDVTVVENSSIYLCHGAFCCDFQVVVTATGYGGGAGGNIGDGDGDGDSDCSCALADQRDQVKDLEELVMELIPEEEVPPQQIPPIGGEEAVEVPGKREATGLLYYYRAVVFNGQRSFDGVTEGGLQVCSIIPCTGTDMESCGKLHAEGAQGATFRYVRITGRFARGHALPLPSTLDKELMPLPPDAFTLKATVKRKDTELVMETQRELDFLTFGIYNRNFANDPERQPTIG